MPIDKTQANIGLSAEDFVIIIIIVVTLILALISTMLWFIDEPILVPPPIISIFLGIAVAALLYRFLGGVADASFRLGALRVGGAAAILIFVAWWANDKLAEYLPEPTIESFDMYKHSVPSVTTWFAVDKDSGRPIKLLFPKFNQAHEPPNIDEINNKRKSKFLALNKNDEFIFVKSFESDGQIFGRLDKSQINKINYYNDFSLELNSYRVASFGSAQRIDINRELPFYLETRGFYSNYSQVYMIDKASNEDVYELNMYLRDSKIVKYRGHYYLISVVEVNHQNAPNDQFAKIYVAEIIVNSE